MNLLNRALRVARANVNHWLAAAEDPEMVLEEALGAMQQELIALRQAVAGAIAAQKQTERQAAQCELMAANWQQRGRVVLSQGDETGARDALARRYRYARSAIAWRERLEEQHVYIQRLREHLRNLEQQLSDAKAQKVLLVARARSAQAASKISELQTGASGGSSLSAFERLEEKAIASEAMAAANGDLDEKAAVEAEIAAMRAQQFIQCDRT